MGWILSRFGNRGLRNRNFMGMANNRRNAGIVPMVALVVGATAIYQMMRNRGNIGNIQNALNTNQ